MLFKDHLYFNYQFPEPQYLGAKYTLLNWLHKFIPKEVNNVLDAFAGSQSVAYLFKQLGFRTYTNDFLNFNHQIGLAMIENKREMLTAEEVEMLCEETPSDENFTLMQSLYTDVFLETQQAQFLDNLRSHINSLENIYKRALAFTIISRSLTRKVPMGHFGHVCALHYANQPARIKRNPNLVKPLKKLFLELWPKYQQAVFDNQQDNQSFQENILTLLPKLESLDLVYFDPPYCDSHANYQSFYHLLETYTEYWQDKKFINATKRYEPQRESGFDKKSEVITALAKLFELAQDIPYWLMSYNDRSYPTVTELVKMISKYKEVRVETKTYSNGRGGKGSVAGSQEVLLIGKNKPSFYKKRGPS